MKPHVEALRRQGIDAATVPGAGKLPTRAERAADMFLAAAGDRLGSTVLGGQSYGGRVASLVAASRGCAALLLFSYPLHPPGRPESLRTEHWPAIKCPVLLLSGESDTFARIDVLRREISKLAQAELVTYPNAGHGLKGPHLDDALARAAQFVLALQGHKL